MTGPIMRAGDRRSHGSVYIGALVALTILGVMLSQFGVLWATQDRRAREADLLAHGNEIRRAIGAYYDASPAGQYPKSLDELVLDPRQPVVARYLRRAWRDPLTEGGEWGIVPGPDNGIVGVPATRSGSLSINRKETDQRPPASLYRRISVEVYRYCTVS
ncbi:type II secretion system protein [Cupriavidus necator]